MQNYLFDKTFNVFNSKNEKAKKHIKRYIFIFNMFSNIVILFVCGLFIIPSRATLIFINKSENEKKDIKKK